MKFLPKYSPEFNPIELAWGKLKAFVRSSWKADESLLSAILCGAMTITSDMTENWFLRCCRQFSFDDRSAFAF